MVYLRVISGCSPPRADSASTMSDMVATTLGRARELFPLAFIIHYMDGILGFFFVVVENNRMLEDLFAEGKIGLTHYGLIITPEKI